MHRVVGSLFGAVLAVGAASAGAVGLSSGVASAASTVAPTSVSLSTRSASQVTVGKEAETFTGTVTGMTPDGRPTGTVTVVATNTSTVCTVTMSSGTGDVGDFTCTISTMGLNSAGTYTVKAHYTGGASTPTGNTYAAKTSTNTLSLRVTIPETPSVTLHTITSPVAHGFETQTFTGTVTGQTSDGFPMGEFTVETSGGTPLCSGTLTDVSGVTADFSCTVTNSSVLSAGGYTIEAKYTGGTSSASSYHYTSEVSTARHLTVVNPTSELPTVYLEHITTPVAYGSEAQDFSGTVEGVSPDGYPKTGVVVVRTSADVVLCTGSLTGPVSNSSVVSHFTCDARTSSELPAGTYSVYAQYTGGASSDVGYEYEPARSGSQTLTVTGTESTTTTLALNYTSRTEGAETSEVLSVTVTGTSGHGYPKGGVTVQTTLGATVCSTSTRSNGSSDSSVFACSPSASDLASGTYYLTATYTPATTSSSTVGDSYTTSTSAREELTVVGGVATTSTLSLGSASERNGHETSDIFSVVVTGKSGDGYPKGTVEVKTSGGTALCTRTTATTHGSYTATYACSPGATALGTGTYAIEATYTPAASSSSTASIGYLSSTSTSETFKVTTPSAARIYGATSDATAAAELESIYPGSKGDCPGTSSSRPVVIATDEHYPDALAASYLEKWLGTGMLLTPTTSMTDATLTALRVEGITNVYVVGGPLAVSTSVVSEIEQAYVYECGGTTRTASHIKVVRIAGTTQYTTAEDIAERPGAAYVGSVDLRGAYGLYNDTSGTSSAAPAGGARKTAVLASGAEFQDAEASATLAYADHLPLLLTAPSTLSPQALSAITTLGITQVILMGGPLAVSNAVVTTLVSHGVSVVRVAGTDYTDTAVELADMELGSASGNKGLGWSPTHGVTVTQGHSYTDGLAGAIVAAHGGTTGSGPEPMLLTETPTGAGSYLTAFLREAGSSGIDDDGARVTLLTVLGGPLAISTAVVSSLESDL